MAVNNFCIHYSYVNPISLANVRSLTQSDSKQRCVKILSDNIPDTYLLDNILIVKIIPPWCLMNYEFSERQKIISIKVEQILNTILQCRKQHYNSEPVTSKCYKFYNLTLERTLAPVEQEFFINQKLKYWLHDKQRIKLNTEDQKKRWLGKNNKEGDLFDKIFSIKTDYNSPVLFWLQDLYLSYSIEEEVFSVANPLDVFSLEARRFFISIYKSRIRKETDTASLDLEIAFRTQLFNTAEISLMEERWPVNTDHVEKAWNNFRLHTIKRTLIETLREHPELREALSHIDPDSFFWEQTKLQQSWWNLIVMTLNPRICVYTLSPTPQTSEQ